MSRGFQPEGGGPVSEISVAIIGGTGVYNQSLLDDEKQVTVETKYGAVSMQSGKYDGRRVYFLARHGGNHSVPPHKVNYKANIAALKKVGAHAVLATAAVGTLRREMPPGSIVVIDQFIDLTKQRPLTFYDGEESPVVHTDFSEPYCKEIREAVFGAGETLGQGLVDGGCYVCTEGPRFETPAEIRMIEQWGGDLVGMTNVPEVVLAREAGLCYAALALPTNYAAGISLSPLTHEEVLEEMDRGKAALDNLLAAFISTVKPQHSCSCKDAGKYWPGES